jgi:hypothetical protein
MSTRLVSRKIQLQEGTPLVLVARVENAQTGVALTSADVTSFAVFVYLDTGTTPSTTVYSLGAIDKTTAWYDVLLYDAQNMLGDAGGYNFRYVISYEDFQFAGGNRYRVEIVSSLGTSFHVQIYDIDVVETRAL